jgi:hypothetical protein
MRQGTDKMEEPNFTLYYGTPIRLPADLARKMVRRLNKEGSSVYRYEVQDSGEYAIVAAYSKATGDFVAYYNFDILKGPGFISRER